LLDQGLVFLIHFLIQVEFQQKRFLLVPVISDESNSVLDRSYPDGVDVLDVSNLEVESSENVLGDIHLGGVSQQAQHHLFGPFLSQIIQQLCLCHHFKFEALHLSFNRGLAFLLNELLVDPLDPDRV